MMTMKRRMLSLLMLLLTLAAMPALAEPELSGVAGEGVSLVAGDGWYFDYDAGEDGVICAELISESGERAGVIAQKSVAAGAGRVTWDGALDGEKPAPGEYTVRVTLTNGAGEQSDAQSLALHIFATEAEHDDNVLDIEGMVFEEAQTWDGVVPEDAVPYATSFWDMDPDAYDLKNPEHQQAIWDLMMQPITVLEVEQKEHVYPTFEPGGARTPYKGNCAGQLHGQSQGVHVLEEDTDGDGYVLIEAYSNDALNTESDYMMSLNAKKIQGYVRTSVLKTVEPATKYALLVDKLRQKMYIFEDGRITGELLVSTGKNTETKNYLETPAGEYLIVSWMGDFHSGGRAIGKYALRINGGTLIHEVLHDLAADGTKFYEKYEARLGFKASHACIRVQRYKNPQGQNMYWLWENMEMNTRVFIWDQYGREMYDPEIPDRAAPLYRNPNGGSNYHLDQNCSGVKERFLPLEGGFTYGDLAQDTYKDLTPCPYCFAPLRLETLREQYTTMAEDIGYDVPADVLAMFEY